MTILVTGDAGFIGHHVARALLERGEAVIGIDNLDPYYDVSLKRARLGRLDGVRGYRHLDADIADRDAVFALVDGEPGITGILHLAAQAGVRHSLVDPYAYVRSNVLGHLVVLEAARRLPRLEHLVYASSSSVYGTNATLPFTEADRVDSPTSVYAVTKRCDELLSQAYAHLHGLPQTGLRFFTVYGPWGRPDMAYYRFADAIVTGQPVTLYDDGEVRRDFTYVDDVVTGVLGVLDHPPGSVDGPRVLNIGNHRSEPVTRLLELLEAGLGRRAIIATAPRPAADVAETFASVLAIEALVGFRPCTSLDVGVPRFTAWYRDYHRLRNG